MNERTAWSAPGRVAEELIGFGAAGEVWRGRSLRTGEAVALKRLYAAPDEDDLSRLRCHASRDAGPGHSHLLPLHEIVADGGVTILVLAWAASGSLATLLRRRGRLRAGEVVTALSPVAAALACLHDAGLGHGAIRPANVLFTVDGRPLLAEPGLPSVASGRSDPDEAEPAAPEQRFAPGADVYRLAELAVVALTGSLVGEPADRLAVLGGVIPPALTRVLQRALAAHPDDRGSAAELALDLARSCPSEPIHLDDEVSRRLVGLQRLRQGGPRVPGAAVVPARRPTVHSGRSAGTGPRHRRPEPPRRPLARRVRWLAAGLAALAGVGGVWAAGSRGRPAGATPAALGGRPGTAADWLAVLDGLDAVRARAYAVGDPALLRQVYVPGAHLAVDTAQLRRLTATGNVVSGVRHRLTVASVTGADAARARLLITQSLPESTLLHAGRAVATVPGTAVQAAVIELIHTPDGWRLA